MIFRVVAVGLCCAALSGCFRARASGSPPSTSGSGRSMAAGLTFNGCRGNGVCPTTVDTGATCQPYADGTRVQCTSPGSHGCYTGWCRSDGECVAARQFGQPCGTEYPCLATLTCQLGSDGDRYCGLGCDGSEASSYLTAPAPRP